MSAHQETYVELDEESFDLACHHLISHYIKTELGCLRNQFVMDLHRDLTSGQSYISIDRPIHPVQDDLMDSLDFGAFNVEDRDSDMETFDADKMQVGDDDQVMSEDHYAAPAKGRLDLDRISYVHYEIHFHPTYRVPYLWFHMKNLPAGEGCFDIDAVYRHLVPDHLKGPLREIGVQGGISAAVRSSRLSRGMSRKVAN